MSLQTHPWLSGKRYMNEQKSEAPSIPFWVKVTLPIILGIVLVIFTVTRKPSPLISPNDDSPILVSMKIREDASKSDDIVYIDVRYQDLNGDAEYIDWMLVNSSTDDVFIYDSYLKDSKEKQIGGSAFTGALYCLGGKGVVTLRVILYDKAGNESNPLEFELTCK